jgi:hypothetical protein
MSPEQLAEVILGIAGVILQLLFQYAPWVKDWFEGLSNKGLVALALDVLVGAALFGISCSPFAEQLGVGLVCETATVFLLLKAIFILAMSQQAAYLFGRRPARG